MIQKHQNTEVVKLKLVERKQLHTAASTVNM